MNGLEICAVFAKNLTAILVINGMTQSELATRLGVSKAQVSDWCAGKNIPRTNYLASMVDVLNCKLSDLLVERKPTPASEGGPSDPVINKIMEIVRQMSPEMRKNYLSQLEILLEMQEKGLRPNIQE